MLSAHRLLSVGSVTNSSKSEERRNLQYDQIKNERSEQGSVASETCAKASVGRIAGLVKDLKRINLLNVATILLLCIYIILKWLNKDLL
jgi:hypothetical protein